LKRGRALLRDALWRAALLGAASGLIGSVRLFLMEHPANWRTFLIATFLALAGAMTGFAGAYVLNWLRSGAALRVVLGGILSAPAIVGLFGILFFVNLRLVRGRIDADFEAEGWRHLLFRLVHDTGGIAVATGGVYLAPGVLACFALAGALIMSLPARRAL
jgi:hypothetical protein